MKKFKLVICTLMVLGLLLSSFGCGVPEIKLRAKKVEADKDSTLLDLIDVDDEDNDYSIEAKNSDIDLGKCGKYSVTYVISKDGEKLKEKKFSFTVVDTTPPAINVTDTINIKKGTGKLDIKKYADISDNSSDKVDISVSGSYNLNKTGSYKIKIKAKDSSGNSSEAKAVLTVSKNDDNEDGTKTYDATASAIKGYWKNSSKDKLMIIQKEKNKYSNLKVVFSILSEGTNSETDGGSVIKLTKSDNTYKITFINTENKKMKLTIKVKDEDKIEVNSKYKAINGTYKKTSKDVLD